MPKRSGYASGQVIEVIMTGVGEPAATAPWQRAIVVRTFITPDRLPYALAFEYQRFAACADGDAKNVHLIVRVLVVERDPNIASLTRDLLEHEGYEVVIVANREEALEIPRTDMFDFLLAELEGGEVNGKELCSIVKENCPASAYSCDLADALGRGGRLFRIPEGWHGHVCAMPCQPGNCSKWFVLWPVRYCRGELIARTKIMYGSSNP
jgi:hypothetical protein